MPYVYSTLSSDQTYCQYPKKADPKGIPQIIQKVNINGKANVTNKKTFVTPKGVVTEITDEQLKILEGIPAFRDHREAGFIVVDTKKTEPAEVAKKDMSPKDLSSQLVEDDFKPDKAPKVNTSEQGNKEPA